MQFTTRIVTCEGVEGKDLSWEGLGLGHLIALWLQFLIRALSS